MNDKYVVIPGIEDIESDETIEKTIERLERKELNKPFIQDVSGDLCLNGIWYSFTGKKIDDEIIILDKDVKMYVKL